MSLENFEFAEHVIGFIVTDKITVKVVEDLHGQIETALQKFDKISIYFEDANDLGFEWKGVYKDFFYKLKKKKRFARIALVSDNSIIRLYFKIKNLFVDSKIKVFKLEDRAQALAWVSMI